MEQLRDNLMMAKELARLVRERETLKRQSVVLHTIGTATMLLNSLVELEKQRAELLGEEPNLAPFKRELADLEAIFHSKHKKEGGAAMPRPVKEPAAALPARAMQEQPIVIENGAIICNFEFACIMSCIAQKAVARANAMQQDGARTNGMAGWNGMINGNVRDGGRGGMGPLTEEERAAREARERLKQRVRVEKRKRTGRLGETFSDRKVVSGPIQPSYEPDWSGLVPAVPAQTKALAEASQEQLFRLIQEQYFGGIYVASDEEETLDELDKKYKYLGSGYKNYTRQKRKLGAERAPEQQSA